MPCIMAWRPYSRPEGLVVDSPGCGAAGVVGCGVVSCCAKAGPATSALLMQNSIVLYSFNFIASLFFLWLLSHWMATPPDVTSGQRRISLQCGGGLSMGSNPETKDSLKLPPALS